MIEVKDAILKLLAEGHAVSFDAASFGQGKISLYCTEPDYEGPYWIRAKLWLDGSSAYHLVLRAEMRAVGTDEEGAPEFELPFNCPEDAARFYLRLVSLYQNIPAS